MVEDLVLLTRPDVDAEQVIFAKKLSTEHLDYLRHWFDKPWAKVSLADLSDRKERISLVDVYVPLQVDFGIVVQTKDQKIEDWRADIDDSERRSGLAEGMSVVMNNNSGFGVERIIV